MEIEIGILTVPLTPGRAEAAHKSEQTTQLLFGEQFKILKKETDWVFIENQADNYRCYIQKGSYKLVPPTLTNALLPCEQCVVAATNSPLTFTNFNSQIPLPAGAILPNFNPETKQGNLLGEPYTFDGAVALPNIKKGADEIIAYAKTFLNSPYLWGGKSFMGFDCSGITQIAFRVNGHCLPRDSYQQLELGTKVLKIADAVAGDLCFFANSAGKIVHVGMYMGGGKIIHSSQRVRISNIDDKGIFEDNLPTPYLYETTGTYTHSLHAIKRVL